MKLSPFLFACIASIGISSLLGNTDTPSNYPVIGTINKFDDRLDELIDDEAPIEVIASGFVWTEGPAWNKEGDFLVFSDIPRNVVMKWSETEGLSEYLRPAGYTGIVDYGREPGSNGLLFDAMGRLTLCEHGDRRISVLTKDGENEPWRTTTKESDSTAQTIWFTIQTVISILPTRFTACPKGKTIRDEKWITVACFYFGRTETLSF